MGIEIISDCVIYREWAYSCDAEELKAEMCSCSFKHVADHLSAIQVVMGSFKDKQFKHSSRVLCFAINDMLDIGADPNYNAAFIRRIPRSGEPLKRWPFNNARDVILLAFGDYEGGEFTVNGREIALNSCDIMTIPATDENGVLGPMFSISPVTKGTMYVLSLHCFDE